MLLVSIEGIPSKASAEVFRALMYKLMAIPNIAFEVANADPSPADPYTRILHFFDAVQSTNPHCRVLLVPRSFYPYAPEPPQVLETARALNAALLPPVTQHLMFVLQPDPHDAYSDALTSNSQRHASLSKLHAGSLLCLNTVKSLQGHPWPAYAAVVPLPPFTADNPVIVDSISSKLAAIVLKRLP